MWIMARREDGCRAGLPMTRHTATSSRTSRVVCVWTRYDNTDSNFFYDYLALLGTMQPGSLGTNSSVSDGVLSLSNSSCRQIRLRNQHFFSTKQTEKMLGWIKEAAKDWQKFTTWRATYRDATFALENFEAAIILEKFKRSYSKNKHYVSYLVDVCNLLLRSVISLWLRCVVSLVTLLQLTAYGLVLADFILWTCPKFSFSFAEMALLNESLNGPTDVRWLTPAACWRQLLLPVQSLWRHRQNFHKQNPFGSTQNQLMTSKHMKKSRVCWVLKGLVKWGHSKVKTWQTWHRGQNLQGKFISRERKLGSESKREENGETGKLPRWILFHRPRMSSWERSWPNLRSPHLGPWRPHPEFSEVFSVHCFSMF